MKAAFLVWMEFPIVRIISALPMLPDNISLQLPLCSPYPGPLSVLVLNNTKIHHSYKLLELVDHFSIQIALRRVETVNPTGTDSESHIQYNESGDHHHVKFRILFVRIHTSFSHHFVG